MIASQSTLGWAQTGYIREKDHLNGALVGFSQYKRATGVAPVTKWFGGPSINSIHSYQSYVSGAVIVLYIDTYKVDQTNFDPASYWGAQPWSSQFEEETGHCQTDVPGLASDKVHFTQLRIRQGGSWVAPPSLSPGSQLCGTKYGRAIVNATSVDLWTAVP
jgi:hypothetical protein